MIFLNSFWTWQYIVMLLFVFWALAVARRAARREMRSSRTALCCDLVFAALGTFFFHNVW